MTFNLESILADRVVKVSSSPGIIFEYGYKVFEPVWLGLRVQQSSGLRVENETDREGEEQEDEEYMEFSNFKDVLIGLTLHFTH